MVSIILAYLNYRSITKKQEDDKKSARDKEILEQAITSLKWAFNTLTEGKENELPRASRLNWLTTSRHIVRYKALKKLIKTDTYLLLCAEKEEYWRHRFYVLLDRIEFLNKNYFMDQKDKKWPENIELTSAMIITDFSSWPKNTIDPLESIDRDLLMKNGNPFLGSCGRGLKTYYNEILEAKERMASNNKKHNK